MNKKKINDLLLKMQTGENCIGETANELCGLFNVSVCAEKPPLGLKPRKFVDEDRLREIQGAIKRYYDANKPMPLEWIKEYNEIVERLH